MLCYVMLCYVMLCYVILYYIILYYIILYYIILYYIILYYIILYYIILYYIHTHIYTLRYSLVLRIFCPSTMNFVSTPITCDTVFLRRTSSKRPVSQFLSSFRSRITATHFNDIFCFSLVCFILRHIHKSSWCFTTYCYQKYEIG